MDIQLSLKSASDCICLLDLNCYRCEDEFKLFLIEVIYCFNLLQTIYIGTKMHITVLTTGKKSLQYTSLWCNWASTLHPVTDSVIGSTAHYPLSCWRGLGTHAVTYHPVIVKISFLGGDTVWCCWYHSVGTTPNVYWKHSENDRWMDLGHGAKPNDAYHKLIQSFSNQVSIWQPVSYWWYSKYSYAPSNRVIKLIMYLLFAK